MSKKETEITSSANENTENSEDNENIADPSAINDTFAGSPVTSESSAGAPPAEAAVDLSKAKITVPADAVQPPPAAAPAPAPEEPKEDNSFAARAARAGIGLVQVEGVDFRYIGTAPARDKDAKTQSGYPITIENSRFTPLSEVAFHPSLRFKDAESGEYFYAPNATGFEEVEYKGNPLVPEK